MIFLALFFLIALGSEGFSVFNGDGSCFWIVRVLMDLTRLYSTGKKLHFKPLIQLKKREEETGLAFGYQVF